MNEDVKRILFCCPQTAGDVLISTGVVNSLCKKFPNAKVYFATEPQYFDILEGNPDVYKVIPYHDSMLNYRNYESFAMFTGLFDMVFCPFIITQRIPHWIHSGKGEWLGRCYADMCHVEYGQQYIGRDKNVTTRWPQLQNDYITVHSQSRQDPKDYDFIEDVVKRIKNKLIVQIGGPRDKKLNLPNLLDLRGQTTPQELASVLGFSKMHLGMDSFPMHVALLVGTNTVATFGGTYAKQGTNPATAHLLHAIETIERGPCVTSCHLSQCEAKNQGHDKCINNISVDSILEEVAKIVGQEHVVPPEPIKISSYMIIKDGIKYGFPFIEAINAARKVSDEVVVVDGGSRDGTWERLQTLVANWPKEPACIPGKVTALQHPWDMDNPTLFGDEKTWARQQCTGNWLIQLDADEIIQEPKPGAIRELIKKHQSIELLDLPIVNFYGDENSTRIEENCWKWRISKNNPSIIHGVHAEARQFDADTMKITMDKNKSDGCEYIYSDSLKIVPHKAAFPMKFAELHYKILTSKNFAEYQATYMTELEKLTQSCPMIFHYSWYDLERKQKNGEFWNDTYHGKRSATHNTTQDIAERVEENKKNSGELIVFTPINHPLRKTSVNIVV